MAHSQNPQLLHIKLPSNRVPGQVLAGGDVAELERSPKNALIYLRVSTSRQASKGGEVEGYSIPAQRKACIEYAKRIGAVVVEEFVDAGASARTADRAALQRMLDRIDEQDIDVVIVHKLDRLARSVKDAAMIGAALKQRGIELLSVSENIDETPSGQLMKNMHVAWAEFYSATLPPSPRRARWRRCDAAARRTSRLLATAT